MVRLRRRKVVQWGLAYIAGAWALLQVLGFAADAFGWPSLIKQVAMLGLLLGLPLVVTLAWYHGDRGQQRITGQELALLTALLLVSGGLLWWYADRRAETTPTVAISTVSSDQRPSIAVLPFENRSDQSKDAYFVDGIHDDILTQLSKISALKVISRTSVEQFRDTKLPMKAIADQLGVTRILEGGVQRAGDRVRIHVQLIDASSDAHLWAESYDRELSAANIFAIQREVAVAIAGALQAKLTVGEQARVNAIPTKSLEAWQAYQLGRQRMASRTSATLIEAEEHFRKAIALDPSFALAWVGLGDSLRLQITYAGRPKDAVLGEAEQAAGRALELDLNLAEAWASAGGIAYRRLQLERAEQMLRRAITLNPNYAPAHHWLSLTLTDLGRRDEALALAERAVMLDPLSAIINNWLGLARMNVGYFDNALAAFGLATEIDPTMAIPYRGGGDVYASGFGRLDTAMVWYEKAASLDPGDPEILASAVFTYWALGDDTEAERGLARMLAIGDGTAYTNFVAALLSLDLGDDASARRHAQRAADLDPVYLFLIRDHDLGKGGYAVPRARYTQAFPHLFAKDLPKFKDRDAFAAIDLAHLLQHTGEAERAEALLDRSEAYIQTIPRMGNLGYGLSDVAIHALRGQTTLALGKLREAEQAGWRGGWRYYRDFDPNLASIRNEPEFNAVFADIERDMAQQRARIAAHAKDTPLQLRVPRGQGVAE